VKPYTRRQLDILRFVGSYVQEHGMSPTLEEIGEHLGVHRVTVFQHLNALERRGAVRRSRQLARSIEVLDPDFLPSAGVQVLGTIAAGTPIEALEEPELIEADDVLPTDGDHYALRVQGDSMIEDGIHDGDLVVVRKTSSARNGQVVVAIVEGEEATLKRLYREPDGRWRLQPANARLRPLVVDDVEVRGVVVTVIRRL
jgi:repressor LexA